MPDRYLIHPAIGVARIGDSTDQGYDGPERYDQDFVPAMRRDGEHKIRRQAAVFKIYKYTYSTETAAKTFGARARAIEEVTLDKVKKISWTIHIANRKSFVGVLANPTCDLPTDAMRAAAGAIDPGPRLIEATNGEPPPAPQLLSDKAFKNLLGDGAPTVRLGEISTDAAGHLRVLGGHGMSGKAPGAGPPDALRNQLWWDDVADGWIEAEVTFNDDSTAKPVGAWVATGVPDFAHAIEAPITVYERALDIAAQGPFASVHGIAVPPYHVTADRPSFVAHIWRVLHAAEMTRFASSFLQTFYDVSPAPTPPIHHFTDRLALLQSATPDSPARKAARQHIFDNLRTPPPGPPGAGNMPYLHLVPGAADRGLSLLETQYKFFHKWVAGHFDEDSPAGPPQSTPRQLDNAHMRSMVGGAFWPGIEVGENMAGVSNWEEPFRIRHKDAAGNSTAGLMGSTLAVPWQSDFLMCSPDSNNAGGWWPSHRPDSILPETAATPTSYVPWFVGNQEDMRTKWQTLGFLTKGTIASTTVYKELEHFPPR